MRTKLAKTFDFVWGFFLALGLICCPSPLMAFVNQTTSTNFYIGILVFFALGVRT